MLLKEYLEDCASAGAKAKESGNWQRNSLYTTENVRAIAIK